MARRRGHTDEQILAALRHAEGRTTVVEVCRQMGSRSRRSIIRGAGHSRKS